MYTIIAVYYSYSYSILKKGPNARRAYWRVMESRSYLFNSPSIDRETATMAENWQTRILAVRITELYS